jgi:hypothetical protein
VTSTRFRDAEFIITFRVQDPSQLERSGPSLASSNVEPANGITSFPILARPK